MKNLLLTLNLLLSSSLLFAQTSYTWDGSVDTDFATADNWTPSGVPGSGDNITIVSTSNDPVLDGNRTVNNLTMTSGILKLGGYDITVDGTADLNGGTIQNGILKQTQGGADFDGTLMDCKVDISGRIWGINSTVFKDSVKLDHTSSATYNMGGNIFEGPAEFLNGSSATIRLGVVTPDTLLATVTFDLSSAGLYYIGNSSAGNYFADDVTLIANSGTTNHGFYIGNTASVSNRFDGDIIMNVTTGSGFINFKDGTNEHDGSLVIGAQGYHSGVLTLAEYEQLGAYAIDLSNMDGTSSLYIDEYITLEGDLIGGSVNTTVKNYCHFKGDVTLPKLTRWARAIFDGKATLTTSGGATMNTGGSIYKDTTVITHNNTAFLNMGNNVVDTFLMQVTFNLNNGGSIYLGNSSTGNLFAGDVILNRNSGGMTRGIYIGNTTTASSRFEGDIYVSNDNTNGPIKFAMGTIVHDGVLKVGSEGFDQGTLYLTKYQQTSSGTMDLSTVESGATVYVQTGVDITADLVFGGGGTLSLAGATFRGDVDIKSSSLPVTNCDFHGTAVLEKTGGTNNLNKGNVFRGVTTIENSSTGNYQYWGYSTPDTFLNALTLINRSSQPLWMNYTSTGQYGGDIILDGDSAKVIRFGSSTAGRVAVFNGTTDQHLNVLNEDLDVQAYRMEVNKTEGRLKIHDNLTISYELKLTDGIIEMYPSSASGSGPVLTLNDGVEPTGTDASYIEGPVKKIGNDAYTFPVGRNGVYRPIGIGAPSNATDAFTAEYFENNSDHINSHDDRDASLDHLSTNEYWTLTRDAGTSTPTVSLSWDTLTSCAMEATLTARHVAGWDGANWDDLGNGGTSGNADVGTVVSSAGVGYFEMFVLESDGAMECECEHPPLTIGPADTCLAYIPMNDNELWINLIPDSSKINLDILSVTDNDLGVIDSILIYEACGGSPIYTKGIDTVFEYFSFALEIDNLVANDEYKLRLRRKDVVTAHNAFNICLYRGGGGAPCDSINGCDLVENGDLEDVNNFAVGLAGLCTNFGAVPNTPNGINSPLCGWISGGGTPDVHSSACDGFGLIGNPSLPGNVGWLGTTPLNNPIGGGIVDNYDPQNMHYLSIATYRYAGGDSVVSNTPNFREYIASALNEPLDSGVCYYYTYDVVNRNNHNRLARFMTPGIGIAFSQGQMQPDIFPGNTNGLILPLAPTILEIHPNTIGPGPWTTVGSVITPTVNNLNFITLGNFLDDNQMPGASDLVQGNPNWIPLPIPSLPTYARYHFDNIHVIKMAIDADTNVFCGGDAMTLGCGTHDGFDYIWTYEGDTLEADTFGILVRDPFLPEHVGTYTLDVMAPDSSWCHDEITVYLSQDDNLGITGCEYTCLYDSLMPCTLSVELPIGYTNVEWEGLEDTTIIWTANNDSSSIFVSDWGNYYGEEIVIGVHALDPDGKPKCNYIILKGCCIASDGMGGNLAHVVNLDASDFNSFPEAPTVLAGGIINEDFTVTGTMTVDTNLTLTGCEVTLSEGATIDVLSPFTLTITDNTFENSWLHACDTSYLWHKLIVRSGGNLTVNRDPALQPVTTIEDAYFGTLFHGDGELDIRRAVYDRNIFHVFVEDKTDSASAIITDNDFLCTSRINTNDQDRRETLAGLFAKNSNIMSGTDLPGDPNHGLPGNYFSNAKYGIIAENSNLEFWNSNEFDSIRKLDPYDGFRQFAGWGIYAYSTDGNDYYLNGGKNNNFHDSDQGIETRFMHDVIIGTNTFARLDGGQDAAGNSYDWDGFGVRVHGNTGMARVTEGSYTDCEWAIMAQYNPVEAPDSIHISSNSITQNVPYNQNTRGVAVIGFGSSDDATVVISNHAGPAYGIENQRYGIWVASLENPIVYGNDIDVPVGITSFNAGVIASNCSHPEIVRNEITGGLHDGDKYYAISTKSCPYPDIRCNTLSTYWNAMFLNGGLDAAIVENNVMTNCAYGLTLKLGYINDQGTSSVPSENVWEFHDNFNAHTRNIDGTSFGNGLNGLHVDTAAFDTDIYPNPFVKQTNQSTLFEIIPLNSSGTSSDTECESLPKMRLPNPDVVKTIAADTMVFYGADSLITRELARLALYKSVKRDTLFTKDSTILAFIDTMDLTAYKDLDSIEARMALPLDSSAVKDLLSMNDKVNTKDTLQALLKEVLGIGLEHYFSKDSSWTETHLADLRAYAALCPYEYGPAVYHARNLLLAMDTAIVFYEHVCETPVAGSQRLAAPVTAETEHNYEGTLKLYPNPTTGSVTIECHLKDEDVAELMVFDMSGRSVYRNSNVCGPNALHLDGLSEGIYHCVLVVNGKASLSEKLVILRE